MAIELDVIKQGRLLHYKTVVQITPLREKTVYKNITMQCTKMLHSQICAYQNVDCSHLVVVKSEKDCLLGFRKDSQIQSCSNMTSTLS